MVISSVYLEDKTQMRCLVNEIIICPQRTVKVGSVMYLWAASQILCNEERETQSRSKIVRQEEEALISVRGSRIGLKIVQKL